jgi:low affinity Fe/Cu permease
VKHSAPAPSSPTTLSDAFRRFANAVAAKLGTPWAFLSALVIIIIWAATGPLFAFADTWQLVINTATTIITFLMVFIIQTTQNRDARAIHLKLDELIRSSKARNIFAHLEEATDAEIAELQAEFEALCSRRTGRRVEKGTPRDRP